MHISSLQNSRVKDVVRLSKRRERDKRQHTVVEGIRECTRALAAGITPLEAYVCYELLEGQDAAVVLETLQQLNTSGVMDLFGVTPPVFSKMAYRGHSGGIVLIIPYREENLETISLSKCPFIVIIDGAEKPGNVGAILRTADAAGVDTLILSDNEEGGTDIHNPNVIRASLGAFFTVPLLSLPAAAIIKWLQEHEIKIVATTPQAELVYSDAAFDQGVAVVMGSEALGLGESWLETADLQVRIPMFGQVDSLNLSVSTALLLYEVIRQRGSH